MERFPQRPDLPYQLLLLEHSGVLLKAAPESAPCTLGKSGIHEVGLISPNCKLHGFKVVMKQMWLGSLQSHLMVVTFH